MQGEIALLTHMPRMATVVALKSSSLLEVCELTSRDCGRDIGRQVSEENFHVLFGADAPEAFADFALKFLR